METDNTRRIRKDDAVTISRQAYTVRSIFARFFDAVQRSAGHDDRFKDHPGFDRRSGRENLTVWEKILRAVRNRGFDAPGYVFFAMRKISSRRLKEMPVPNMLLSSALLDLYAEVCGQEREAVVCRWTDQLLLFDAEVYKMQGIAGFAALSDKKQRQFVILKADLVFSELFLFYQAMRYDLPEIYGDEKIFETACFQYSLFPDIYDSVIDADKILEKLRTNDVTR
jgi:hypothetical protein